MNSRKAFLISCIISSSVMTASAQAASVEEGVNACMDALQIHFEKSDKKVNVSLSSNIDMPKARLGQWQEFHLDTLNMDTKALYSTVSCVVNNRARVKRLNVQPMKIANTNSRTVFL
ncbi:MAG: hypothetical protein ACI89U_001225 [Gammaproteobacteria bacterium]|jgi:hypothetical protein